MANIASSKKDARRSAERALRNRSVKSAVKTSVTKFRRAATADQGEAGLLGTAAVSALDRAASKGILHANNAARRKSRLMRRLNQAAAAAEPASAPETPKARKAVGTSAPRRTTRKSAAK